LRRQDLSVRRLAEFLFSEGDLHTRAPGRQVDPEEGIAAQKIAQEIVQASNPNYLREFALSAKFDACGQVLKLSGRADGVAPTMSRELKPVNQMLGDQTVALQCNAQEIVVIEEYKCTGLLPDVVDVVDLGQACLYGWLYAQTQEVSDDGIVEARVIYLEADSTRSRVFGQRFTMTYARAWLAFALLCYEVRIARHLVRTRTREDWLQNRAFPHGEFRMGQRAIAERVYVALRDGENLLLEAPTGSGKSIATLYPALKLLGAEQQIFFLTSRNMGAHAAREAVRQIDPENSYVASVEIIAKEKACPVEGTPCDPDVCEYANGYFDRVGAAVEDVLSACQASGETIAEIARAHTVCPFELSLDAASWADVIVGDYNYIFDPVVALHRFNEHPQMHLLIDESHQLSARARDMLGAALSREMLVRKHPHPVLRKRIQSIDRALLSIAKDAPEGDSLVSDISGIERALTRFMDSLGELLDAEIDLRTDEPLREMLYAITRWRRSDAWYQSEIFHHRVTLSSKARGKRQVELARVCLDPASYLRKRMAAYHSVVRFSGTVSPLSLYQRLHGVDVLSHAAAERAPSPFSGEEAAVLVVPDVSTYYRARKQSLPKLQQLIDDVIAPHAGHYVIAVPSYQYLNLVAEALDDLDLPVFRQTPGQVGEEAQALLDEFRAADAAVLCIVMGGVFGESVDFANIRLSGVILVGLGLPPPSLDRDQISAYFGKELGAQEGETTAYLQPALVKVVQAAGRLIRSADDIGIVCLVDPRFAKPQVQRFFPTHWQPRVISANQLKSTVSEFWQDKYDHAQRQHISPRPHITIN